MAVVVPTGQDGAAHSTPAAWSWHPPAPLQNPVAPQVEAFCAMQTPAGSIPPMGTGEQVPSSPGSAQDLQLPLQSLVQQTPCEQMPLPHSPRVPQTAPGGLRPQEPALHEAGGAQSASAVQVDLQAATPQPKGKQETAAGVTQVPAPSQVDTGVSVVPVAGQLASRQGLPWAYFWQAPASHFPVVPQV